MLHFYASQDNENILLFLYNAYENMHDEQERIIVHLYANRHAYEIAFFPDVMLLGIMSRCEISELVLLFVPCTQCIVYGTTTI